MNISIKHARELLTARQNSLLSDTDVECAAGQSFSRADLALQLAFRADRNASWPWDMPDPRGVR